MSVSSILIFEEGFNRGIRCSYISNSVKVDSYTFGRDSLLTAIERNMPDLVLMDLYEQIDGIDTSRQIRNQFGIQVIYV